MALTLTIDERTELERRTRSRKSRAEDVRRARVILMLADGESFTTIATAVGCYPAYIARWKDRFETERLAGLRAKYRGQPPTVRTQRWRRAYWPRRGSGHPMAARTGRHASWGRCWVSATCWSLASGAARDISRTGSSATCSRMIRSSRKRRPTSTIGLYLNPPQHAVVFAADEKTAIQALDRLDPVLPLSPGRAERHGFEYFRHGTLSLYAALNTKTGEIIGQTVRLGAPVRPSSNFLAISWRRNLDATST